MGKNWNKHNFVWTKMICMDSSLKITLRTRLKILGSRVIKSTGIFFTRKLIAFRHNIEFSIGSKNFFDFTELSHSRSVPLTTLDFTSIIPLKQ